MERHLFLTGQTGCGKSALLREALGGALASAGGFVMTADCGGYGELTGFSLSPAAAAAGVPGYTALRFLDCTRFPPRSDNEIFRREGVRLLEEALWYPYAVLDEIGGYELLIPQYRAALEALLRSELPLLGALRTEEEADALRQALGLGDKWRRYSASLRALLESDPETLVLDLPVDPARAEAAVRDWVRAYT